MGTERLYYTDSYLTRFEAEIVEVRPAGGRFYAYLDCTAFYPASGGQPFDVGRMGGAAVVDVVDEGDRIAHLVDVELRPGPVACEIDWVRRFDHMQQHTGQHLLSAVFVEQAGYSTVSFHLGPETSTIDLDAPGLSAAPIEAVEARANALVFENRPVTARFFSPEEAASIGLRKPSEREGPIRVVQIEGCDRSACGGTHVRATGEIGPILVRRLDRVRQTVRVEFVCGGRAVRRARDDYNALARSAQLFSAPLDQVPTLVAAQIEAAKAADKVQQKLQAELAVFKGRELYQATSADARGRRVHQAVEPSGAIEPQRLLAQAFIAAGPGGVFLLALEQPPMFLLALSEDLNANAGNIVKAVAESLGGRGGGNARLAQASLPSAAHAPQAFGAVLDRLG
ncbi:MAG: alanyl-tRNA editing protein [Acidobacteria bacterium]|nr:alanyl-tRNA editing protein [Acidobacteriota bacterium]